VRNVRSDTINTLLNAVDVLTLDRTIHTTITDDDTGAWLRIHTETHPPLLTLLEEGTGFSRGPKTAECPLPIDADALELWSQIRDLVRLWCKKLGVTFGDNILTAVRRWYLAHTNAVRSGRVNETINLDVTRMVQAWVRMIENKYDPPEKREWKDPCVNDITFINDNGEPATRRCGARRIMIGGTEEFAIELNVTSLTATCRACHASWTGRTQLAELRFLTNLDTAIRTGRTLHPAAAKLVNTKQKQLAPL